jgi:RNA polymerase sigma factor (sigma-70 family)
MAAAIRSEAEVSRLVAENEKLVDYMVNRYLKRYFVGSMEREDLRSWAMIGLVHAARAWDPARSSSFTTLACKAIERMIIRGVSREWKPDQARITYSLDAMMSDGGSGDGEDRFLDQLAGDEQVEERLMQSETELTVRKALEELSPEQQALIRRHFFEQEPVQEIARDLGLTRQGVYMREKLILKQLRDKLSPAFVEPALAA